MSLQIGAARRPEKPYGSATLFRSQRVGAGSIITSDPVDISGHQIKSFGFRGNRVGSWYIDVSFGSTDTFFALAAGTFPAGPGTIKTASFEEAFRLARARARLSAVGTVSVFYGGLTP